MIPYVLDAIRLGWFALVHDKAAGRRRVRVLVQMLSVSGLVYAAQLEQVSHALAVVVSVLSILCGIVVAAHGDPVAPIVPAAPSSQVTP